MHGFERGFFARSLGLEAVRSACEDRASIACWSSEKCPFALHTSAFCNCAERSSLYAMRAYMHAFGRGLFCMDHFTLKIFEAHAKIAHQSLVISLNPVPLPVACRSAFCCCCEVILFHTPRRRTCTVVDAVFCMDRFSLNLIEAHAKTAHRSLVRSLNTVPLPVACRSAFCCCCEVILFHTPQRRTCTVVDAVFCMDRFSLNLIEAHAKTARR